MIKLFQLLFFGHIHAWEEKATGELTEKGTVIGFYSRCQCKTCGTPKMFNMIARK